VNTVVCRAGKLHGYNTDFDAVMQTLGRKSARGRLRASSCARRLEAARNAARAFGAEAVERKDLRELEFDAVVNATPIGMMPDVDASPLEAAELRCDLVFDLIYRPVRTRLLRLAERRGIRTLSGAEMFVAQGVAQWELWTGEKAPLAAMRAEVTAALAREESRTQESPARGAT